MPRKITIDDIAKSLGVSKTLVSLVLNDKADQHGISIETQKKVKEKIRELNYKPDVLARGFRTGKTNTIGLIVSDISNRFYARIARSIEDLAWGHGYTVIISSTDEDVTKEKEQIRQLRDRKLDGLIISTSQDNPEFFDKLVNAGFPHVLIDRTFKDMLSPNVSVDNFGGARMAARHLLHQGIKRIAVVAITPDHISTISDRIKGFQSALAEEGAQVPEDWIIRTPFGEMDKTIKEKLLHFYQDGNMPEAIFSLPTNLTAACMQNLRNLSIDIPRQVSIIGFDDVSFFSFTRPSISVIAQPIERISEVAFDLLMRQIEGNNITEAEKTVKLPVDIIIRESSLKPRSI